MNTFITGLLVKNETGVASREEVYERWLTLQVAPATQLSIFVSEPGLLQIISRSQLLICVVPNV